MSEETNIIQISNIGILEQSKKEYDNLQQDITNLEERVLRTVENFVKSFITMQVEKYYKYSETLINEILCTYQDRFQASIDTDSKDSWIGSFEFNFGDLVLEETLNKRGIVVKEKENYIWLWLFKNRKSRDIIKINKDTSSLFILKRCDISDSIESLTLNI